MHEGGHHSSVVISAPTILRPWVRFPIIPSMLFSVCIVEIETMMNEKRTKINKKETGIGPYFKNNCDVCNTLLLHHIFT